MKELTNAQIHNTLLELGVDPSNSGYGYLTYGIRAVNEDPSLIDALTKRLYPEIGEHMGSTGSRVERAMRHAIERAFDGMDPETSWKYFGNVVSRSSGKVPNGTFIACVVKALQNMEETA